MSLILLGNLYMSLIKVSLINHNVCMYILLSNGPMNIIFPPLRLIPRTRSAVGANALAGGGCGLQCDRVDGRRNDNNKTIAIRLSRAGKTGNGNGRRSFPDIIWKKPRTVKKTRAYRAFRIAILRQNPLTFDRAR